MGSDPIERQYACWCSRRPSKHHPESTHRERQREGYLQREGEYIIYIQRERERDRDREKERYTDERESVFFLNSDISIIYAVHDIFDQAVDWAVFQNWAKQVGDGLPHKKCHL